MTTLEGSVCVCVLGLYRLALVPDLRPLPPPPLLLQAKLSSSGRTLVVVIDALDEIATTSPSGARNPLLMLIREQLVHLPQVCGGQGRVYSCRGRACVAGCQPCISSFAVAVPAHHCSHTCC
jgi:hypothetical protein